MKGFNKIWHLLPSSPKVSVGDLLLLKKEIDRFPSPAGRQTLRNDVCSGWPHGKTYFVIPEGFCRGTVFIKKGKRQIPKPCGPPHTRK